MEGNDVAVRHVYLLHLAFCTLRLGFCVLRLGGMLHVRYIGARDTSPNSIYRYQYLFGLR